MLVKSVIYSYFSSEYVVCERERFKELSALPGTCIEVVSEWEELEGYKVAMVKDWALNKTRYIVRIITNISLLRVYIVPFINL